MVCKKDVINWIKNLKSYKRIDFMCNLLHLCYPIELRFLGTCLEQLGRRDFHELRQAEKEANSVSELNCPELEQLTSQRATSKLALYISCLSSCNYQCSNSLYQILTKEDLTGSLRAGLIEDKLLEDLLLIYTLALNHPAFSTEQKEGLGKVHESLREAERRTVSRPSQPHQVNHHQVQSWANQPGLEQQAHLPPPASPPGSSLLRDMIAKELPTFSPLLARYPARQLAHMSEEDLINADLSSQAALQLRLAGPPAPANGETVPLLRVVPPAPLLPPFIPMSSLRIDGGSPSSSESGSEGSPPETPGPRPRGRSQPPGGARLVTGPPRARGHGHRREVGMANGGPLEERKVNYGGDLPPGGFLTAGAAGPGAAFLGPAPPHHYPPPHYPAPFPAPYPPPPRPPSLGPWALGPPPFPISVPLFCYNCGSQQHAPLDCPDSTMEDLTKQGQYRIDFSPYQKSCGGSSGGGSPLQQPPPPHPAP